MSHDRSKHRFSANISHAQLSTELNISRFYDTTMLSISVLQRELP